MTQAKTQPFRKKYNLDLIVYNVRQKTILPRKVTNRYRRLFTYNNDFCGIRETNQSRFPDAIKELDKNFEGESNEFSDAILKQVVEFKFPTSYEKNCMLARFVFNLETCNEENQLYCEAFEAGVYHCNRFYECFNGDLTESELKMEREKIHNFDREDENPALDMIIYIINKYKGKPKVIANKHSRKTVSL